MTTQEFYDSTCAHLVAQGRQSLLPQGPRALPVDPDSPFGRCAYRSPEGLKCAAGVHIPDALYEPTMESRSVTFITSEYAGLRDYFPAEDLALATELQHAHDYRDSWDDTGLSAKGRARLNVAANTASPRLVPFFPPLRAA